MKAQYESGSLSNEAMGLIDILEAEKKKIDAKVKKMLDSNKKVLKNNMR